MSVIKDRFIPKEEFMRLLFTKIDGVDTHELSMWLKSQTDDEWVVVPRGFCSIIVEFFEWYLKEESDPKFLPIKEMLERNIVAIKKYL
jgi:hypothetical protein